jgi:hypothetical protein
MTILRAARRIRRIEGKLARHQYAAHHVQHRPLIAKQRRYLVHSAEPCFAAYALVRALPGPTQANSVVSFAQPQQPLDRPVHVPKGRALLSERPLW